MGNPKILVWGAGGHAGVVEEIIRLSQKYEMIGFLDDSPTAQDFFLGLPVFHDFRSLQAGRPLHAIVAVGHCRTRLEIAETVQQNGWILTSAIHPRAVVSSSAVVGDGTVIAAGAVVNPGSALGTSVIVNTGATVDHDCRIADGVHIGPGVHMGGAAVVGKGTWLGIGAIVKDRVTIGQGVVIGAGAVVLRDIPDYVMAYGVPAKPVKELRP
ncbi:MAG: acetyltransferase [Terriglobia bacterium]